MAGVAAMVLLSSRAAVGQTTAPGESSPGAASEPPPTPSAAPGAPEEGQPTEFRDVLEGGVVATAPISYERPWPTQRNLALLATEGSFNGFGLGLRAGGPRLGLETAFAYLPILATYSPDPDTFPELKLLSTFQVNASVYVGLHRLNSRTDLGIAFGYKYNTLLRHGGTVAFYVQHELGAHWSLQGFVGPCIFPDAENQIREKTGWAGGSVLSGLAWHQAGIGVSLAFFP